MEKPKLKIGKIEGSGVIKLNPKNKQIPTVVINKKGTVSVNGIWHNTEGKVKSKDVKSKGKATLITGVPESYHPLVESLGKQYDAIVNNPHTKSVLETMNKMDTSTSEGLTNYTKLKQELATSIFGDRFNDMKTRMNKLMQNNPIVTGLNVQAKFDGKHQTTMDESNVINSDLQFTTGYINTPKDTVTANQQGNIYFNKHFKKSFDKFLKGNNNITKNISVNMGARYSVFEFDQSWLGKEPDASGISPYEKTMKAVRDNHEAYKDSNGEEKFLQNDIEYTMLFNTSKLNTDQRKKLVDFLQNSAKTDEQRDAMKTGDPEKNAWSEPDLRISNKVDDKNLSGEVAFRHTIRFKGNISKSVTPTGKSIELLFTTLSKSDRKDALQKVFGNDATITVDKAKVNSTLYNNYLT